VLHVGDSVDADYLGIKRFGGHGVLLHRGCDKVRVSLCIESYRNNNL